MQIPSDTWLSATSMSSKNLIMPTSSTFSSSLSSALSDTALEVLVVELAVLGGVVCLDFLDGVELVVLDGVDSALVEGVVCADFLEVELDGVVSPALLGATLAERPRGVVARS